MALTRSFVLICRRAGLPPYFLRVPRVLRRYTSRSERAAYEKVGALHYHDAFRANGCPTMEGSRGWARQNEVHTAGPGSGVAMRPEVQSDLTHRRLVREPELAGGGQHDASAVAFDHERDEIANEAAGRRIGSAAKRLFESNGGGSGNTTGELVCEGHTAVAVHHREDLRNHLC